jgi:predicted nucleotidyltransferase
MDFARPIQAVIPGAQGRVLATLARVTDQMNLRTVADLSGVSVAQASRVLARLVDLGLVERRDVPPSALFRLDRRNLAIRSVLELGDLRQRLLDELAAAAEAIEPSPVNITVFGSFARGEERPDSDLDVLVVRPAAADHDDDRWAKSLGAWVDTARYLSGNRVEVLEVEDRELGALLRSKRRVWIDIRRDGVRLFGRSLEKVTS